jgi:DNA topoisomerase-1
MAKHLLIVESPAKAKTIEKYLGEDFRVQASYGHIRDLPKGDRAVDIADNFRPTYVVPDDKQKVVNELRKLAKQAETVWLATDEDREGEAISWHLAEVLGLDLATTKRIVFHEITKTAIQEAVKNPRRLDINLVNAQQARRVLDRIVGFELSPVLWRKVRSGLSAGRVQSVAVRLIVEREQEIQAFNATPFFRVTAEFTTQQGGKLKATLAKDLPDRAAALDLLEACQGAKFQLANLEVKPGKRTPAAPFTTSTLQQEASRKLYMGPAQTMRAAQGLYEAGHITYMRTDSVTLSEQALQAAKGEILSRFGDKYHQRRTYKNKNANAQEAHECIRPTDMSRNVVSKDDREQRLYDLIWKRTLASQMADAQLERTIAHIEIQPTPAQTLPEFLAEAEVIKFDGFLKLYLESRDDDDDDEESLTLLPPMTVGEYLDPQWIEARQRFTRPPSRYTEASLVKKLEELGIGRPSTYAPTISTIQQREYVVKENRDGVKRELLVLKLQKDKIQEKKESENTGAEKNKLFPSDLGTLVTEFLRAHFPDVTDYSFTARVEEEFDVIARGEMQWQEMLHTFYGPFHARVEKTFEEAERVSGERHLGTDPETGKPIITRLGRFGPLVQIGTSDDPDKRFASLASGQRMDTIELAEALKLFSLPRVVGKYEELVIKANVGRFGPYIQHKDKFVSLPKGVDPHHVTLEESIDLIEAKRKSDAERLLRTFAEDSDFQILKGRWGPYLLAKKENIRLPKDADIEAITFEEAFLLYQEALAKKPEKKGRGGKAAAKSTTAKPKAAPKAKPKAVAKAKLKAAPKPKAAAKPKAAPKAKPTKAEPK